jgi:hypothetical protein
MKRPSWIPVVLAIAGATLLPRTTHAQQVMQETTTTQSTGPDFALVASGIVVFGVAYVPSVVAAGSSGLNADRTLVVPLAGPWIDFAARPPCAPATSCNGENTSRVLLVVDGIFQAVGALTVLDGLLTRVHESTTTTTALRSTAPTLHLEPVHVGTGYGMAAIGSF